MHYSRHAGGCCGISVVSRFDNATVVDFDNVIQRHDQEHNHGTPGNRLLEAVLTDRQLDALDPSYEDRVTQSVRDAGGWAVILAVRGFVLQTRFRNSNTGRYCNVFHRVSQREPITGLRWQVPEAPAAPEMAHPNPLPVNDESVWSTSYLDSMLPFRHLFVGLRVQYRHRDRVGTTERLHNMTGSIAEVRGYLVSVNWDVNQRTREFYLNHGFPLNRFVWDTAQLAEPVVEDDPVVQEPEGVQEPVAVLEPVIEHTRHYYAVRRDGTRAGPFETEEIARQRWSRVRQYVRVDTLTIDGDIDQIYENEIAA